MDIEDDVKADKLNATSLNSLTVGTFLTLYLRGLSSPTNLTYLVREDYIEITSIEAAQTEAGITEAIRTAEQGAATIHAQARAKLPLISLMVEDKPLAAVLAELRRVYGLNIVIDRSLQNGLKTPLTQRLLNVPADTALEILAGQAGEGWSVVRKGNVFHIVAGGM